MHDAPSPEVKTAARRSGSTALRRDDLTTALVVGAAPAASPVTKSRRHLAVGAVVALLGIGLVVAVAVVGAGRPVNWDGPPRLRLPCGVVVLGTWETVPVDAGAVAGEFVYTNATASPADNGVGNATVRVAVFRSIPYAEAPVGDRRFRAPALTACPRRGGAESAGRWRGDGALNATAWGPSCPQAGWNGAGAVQGAEACLTLTVHVPESILPSLSGAASDDGASRAPSPVLVYFYGGGLLSGSEHEPLSFFAANAPTGNVSGVPTATATAAARGAVVVVPNYRLGLLGWLAVDAMAAEANGTAGVGNWGLQDQLAALQWVRRNAAATGGDANAVTIMGQSSGGTSVLGLLATPAAAGLFRAAVSLSGSPNITMDRPSKFAQDAAVVAQLGCAAATASATMECLRNATVDALVAALPPSWSIPESGNLAALDDRSVGGLNFPGAIYVDGDLLRSSLWDSLASGVNGNVTLVVSSMAQEGDLSPPPQNVAGDTAAQWAEFLELTVFRTWGSQAGAVAGEFNRAYAVAAAVNPQLAYFSINADYGIGCASAWLAGRAAIAAAAGARTAPVYIAENAWMPSAPQSDGTGRYAFHVWDYLAGIADWQRYGPFTPAPSDWALSRTLRAHWGSLLATARLPAAAGWPEAVPASAAPTALAAPVQLLDATTTFVYARPHAYPFHNATARLAHRAATCLYFRSIGLWQGYWWAN